MLLCTGTYPSFPSRCSCSPARTNPALTLRTDQYSPTPILGSQGPFARVAIGKLSRWMFSLIIKIYTYNNMIRSHIMRSDFFPLILAFQGTLARLALCIIPQKSHSSRRGLIHEGAFYQADVSHMLYMSAWISLVQTKGSKTGKGRGLGEL